MTDLIPSVSFALTAAYKRLYAPVGESSPAPDIAVELLFPPLLGPQAKMSEAIVKMIMPIIILCILIDDLMSHKSIDTSLQIVNFISNRMIGEHRE